VEPNPVKKWKKGPTLKEGNPLETTPKVEGMEIPKKFLSGRPNPFLQKMPLG